MKIFTSKSQKKGELGEKYAANYLINKGYQIFELNVTRKYGEIDIVSTSRLHVSYVEVKSMQKGSKIHARENLTPAKIERLLRMCNFHFIETMKPFGFQSWSIDGIIVILDHQNKSAVIEHIKNINI